MVLERLDALKERQDTKSKQHTSVLMIVRREMGEALSAAFRIPMSKLNLKQHQLDLGSPQRKDFFLSIKPPFPNICLVSCLQMINHHESQESDNGTGTERHRKAVLEGLNFKCLGMQKSIRICTPNMHERHLSRALWLPGHLHLQSFWLGMQTSWLHSHSCTTWLTC